MRSSVPRSLLWLAIVILSVVPGGCPLGGPPAATNDITVSFLGASSANSPLMLYSGIESGTCEKYKAFVASPTIFLNDVTFLSSCQVEIDVFAPGFSAWVGSIDASVPGSESWLTEAIGSGSLAVAMSSLTSLPLRLWIVAGSTGDKALAESMRNRLLDKAYPVFDALGIGFTFDTMSTPLASLPVPKPECAQAAAIAANPAIYDATRINVYFVRNYANFPISPAMNCWLVQHPEIIFISWGHPNVVDPTLAHELGHALGLVHPSVNGTVGGHTNYVAGFDAYNFMATNTDVTNVSVGQLYAMNFSSDSWVNRPGSPLVRPIVRECQDDWGAGLCPALTMFVPGWPP